MSYQMQSHYIWFVKFILYQKKISVDFTTIIQSNSVMPIARSEDFSKHAVEEIFMLWHVMDSKWN